MLDRSVDRGSQECKKSKVAESTIHPLLRKSSAVACDDHTSKCFGIIVSTFLCKLVLIHFIIQSRETGTIQFFEKYSVLD